MPGPKSQRFCFNVSTPETPGQVLVCMEAPQVILKCMEGCESCPSIHTVYLGMVSRRITEKSWLQVPLRILMATEDVIRCSQHMRKY